MITYFLLFICVILAFALREWVRWTDNLENQLLEQKRVQLRPSREHLVRAMVRGGCQLALKKGETRQLPPCPGTHGTILFSGNSLPVIHYTVFDEELMDFVQVRAEFALPDQVRILPTLLLSTDYQYQKTEVPDGTVVSHDDVGNPIVPRIPTPTPLKPEYEKPALFLLESFHHYFPLTQEGKHPIYDDRNFKDREILRTPLGGGENEASDPDSGTKPGLRCARTLPH